MVYKTTMLVLAAALAACQQGTRVEVSGTAKDVRFAAVKKNGGEYRCADKVSVTPVSPEDAAPNWQIVAVDPNKCIREVRYGRDSADFSEQVPPVPLKNMVPYRVRISGAGFSAVRDFRLTTNGISQDAD